MPTGFYVPGSKSSSYVASKRNEEGSYLYDAAASEIGLQKQAALQDLEKNYATTVENAYASYLANQRAINTAAMGQGYKEAYEQAQQQQLATNIAEANLTAANARSQISQNAQEARSTLEQQFAAEAVNLDRVASSMNNYLTYIKSLSGKDNTMYLSEEDSKKSIDELYETLYGAQPQSLTDPEGNAGMPYLQWMEQQLKTEEDRDWYNWLAYQGGWQDFTTAVQRSKIKPADILKNKVVGDELLNKYGVNTNINLGEFKTDEERLDYIQKNESLIKAKNELGADTIIGETKLPKLMINPDTKRTTLTDTSGNKYETYELVNENKSNVKGDDKNFLNMLNEKFKGTTNFKPGQIVKAPSGELYVAEKPLTGKKLIWYKVYTVTPEDEKADSESGNSVGLFDFIFGNQNIDYSK